MSASENEVIEAQHEETGRLWTGERRALPPRYHEIPVRSHTDKAPPVGRCTDCGTTDFKNFVSCQGDRCEFVLDKPVTIPVQEAKSDDLRLGDGK